MAVVSPYVAQMLLKELERKGFGKAEWREHAMTLRSYWRQPSLADQVEFSYAQLHAAAAEHRAAYSQGRPTSVSGSAEAEVAEVGAGCSSTAGEVPTKEVAEMLGVTARQVLYWLGSGALKGRKVGRSWLVDAGSVTALGELRSAS
jgi:excisionase family DNA binding protein